LKDKNLGLLIVILVLAAIAIWIDWPTNPGMHIHLGPLTLDRDIRVHQGLDLQGGLQVLLEADVPPEQLDTGAMEAATTIVENRVNGLGVTEPLVQRQGDKRIVVQLPGIANPDQAIATLKETGLLEFIDAGTTYLPPGTIVRTTFSDTGLKAGSEITAGLVITDRVFTTVLTGKDLKNAVATRSELGENEIALEFTADGGKKLADYSASHIQQYLAIAVDKEIISCPVIKDAIPDGRARITGKFTREEAYSLAIQLRYGALPVPLKVVETRTVGPTLGQDSVRRSLTAGSIGLLIVLLFMLTYYRFPGLLADLALIIYALLNLALYKVIPVTLTLPGITGFILSTGMAVDANILIFERMKEEIRAGRSLRAAINAGFERAWTSIRDSNLSTLITCIILYWFGSNFGASIVKGFAITLFIGVCISMFTAITVTRTFIKTAFDLMEDWLTKRKWLLGV